MKCKTPSCLNHDYQGAFKGNRCFPCWKYLIGLGGLTSQAYRNDKMSNELEQIKELEAQVAKLKETIEKREAGPKRFIPSYRKDYHVILCSGKVKNTFNRDHYVFVDHYDFFNCYEIKGLAEKAAILMRRSNAIIMAKLLVEPDFEPDWDNLNQTKWGVYYSYVNNKWQYSDYSIIDDSAAHVSSIGKAEQMCELLTEWGVV